MLRFYITSIVPFSVLVPIIAAFLNYRYLTKPLYVILGFILFSGLANFANVLIAHVYHQPTVVLFNIYMVFEFVFLSAYFATFYQQRGRVIIYIIALLSIIFWTVNSLYIHQTLQLNSYARSVNCILVIVYSMLFFLYHSNADGEQLWSSFYANWVTAGILVYYSSSLFMFILSNYLLRASLQINLIVWSAHDTIMILEYVLFAIGFYKCRSQTTIATS